MGLTRRELQTQFQGLIGSNAWAILVSVVTDD